MVRGEWSLTLSPQGRFADQIEALLEASTRPGVSVDLRVGKAKPYKASAYVRKTITPVPCGYCGDMVMSGHKYCNQSHAVMACKARAKAKATATK